MPYGLFIRAAALLTVLALPVSGAPQPNPESGKVAATVGKVLGRGHYSREPLNDAISKKFLRAYLDTLDPNHLFFLQSDVNAFEQKYGARLDDETAGASLRPALEIFDIYVKRVEQCAALVNRLLKEKLSFDEKDEMIIDRDEVPWPADEKDAEKVWRRRVKFELLQERLAAKPPADGGVGVVQKRYERFQRTAREMDIETLLQAYLTALANAYDPHSEYLPPSELENFDIHMRLSMEGIGVLLGYEDGYAKVHDIIAGGPAALDKRLKVGDRIVGVAQGDGEATDVVNMRLNKIVKLIRGPRGTRVRLVVQPGDATDPAMRKEITLVRDKINLKEQEAKARYIEWKDAGGKTRRFGYVSLPSFYIDLRKGADGKSATRDVKALLEKLRPRNIEGLILDLRGNKGGSLEEAVNLTGLFIREGPVVQVKDQEGRVDTLEDEDASVLYEGPLVVLVDHLSASASEIVAAALQDYGRAVIVGDQNTFGKGTVQRIEDLERVLQSRGAGALIMTIQKFYRVSGGSTQYRGVIPDIRLPSILDIAKINESSLKNPLPYDEVAPAGHESDSRTTAVLKKLADASAKRVAADPEYRYIREDVVRIKEQLDKKTVSLNEAQRRAEIKADEDRQEKRKKERAARKPGNLQVTEITLDGSPAEKPKTPEKNPSQNDPDRPSEPVDTPGQHADQAGFEEGLHILQDLVDETGGLKR